MSSPTKNKTPWRLYLAASWMALGAIFWGYDIGIVSTIYVAPGFKKALDHPSSKEIGLITAIYYAGSWPGFVFVTGPMNQKFGRRWTGFWGVAVLCVGAALQAGAVHLSMMIIGRIIAGLGTSLVAAAVPLYLSEIAPAATRGAFGALNQIGIVSGISIAFWCGYGYSHWTEGRGEDLQWRLSVAMQFIPAVIFCACIGFFPESPRWLLEQDRLEDAAKSLALFRCNATPEDLQAELDSIHENILWHKANSTTSSKILFTDRSYFARLWRAWVLNFLQQMSGAAGIRYYLPSNFKAAGTSDEIALLASGIDGSVQVACTVVGLLLIDRVGRRNALGLGAALMAFCLMINGALQTAYPHQINQAANYCNIFFIFLFTLGYSVGAGPTTWIYSSEIFPANVRAKGLGIAASGQSIGAIIVGQVWPVAVSNIGARVYFIFMSFNLLSFVLVYTLYPETARKTLEEIDAHFGKINMRGADDGTIDDLKGETTVQNKEVIEKGV
ncbi:hypothetical protein LTR84_003811 [Exophiala bonariae]|uniref:Major facilitator superfamily (MFS) profile domain-containing protein n=1 Tax=Exophiala bonariae TaxID=1690606 RepID=A0AAV9N6A6_9EURO|nr:hypothetical protein LTR84_003811 [Exophiala bonariae]